ncbi:MAG TPA: glucose 1-dehydrogenase [Methylomirabilota bacterium]|jgi:NAD(P)-dependent dehydrogenase (short-subunit alcohol dehydrogenase family)|nr:glucose 1-dehydrogenase [Methylomirabilota bacterium]
MRRVEGKVAIVTGAGSGIGRAAARLLAREGASVVVADIDPETGQDTVRLIREDGHPAVFVRTDVARAEDVRHMTETAVEHFGRLDVLHNNAYWAKLETPVVETEEGDWDRTLAVTLKGVFLGCKYAIPVMIRGGGGSIINTASTSGLVASLRFAAYIAAKGGVVQLTKSVALDYGRQGIRSNCICPGLIDTPASAPALADPVRREWHLNQLLVGRIGTPEDVAWAVVYLASDESAFMTGHALVIDGGRLVS